MRAAPAHAGRVALVDQAPRASEALREILDGLARRPASLPCRLLYDARGAALFERITELPEYYPTRTELAILRAHGADLAAAIGPDAVVIEPGAGDGRKIRLLLDALDAPAAYVPIDISREQLAHVSAGLAHDYPAIEVLPVCADFTRVIAVPRPRRAHGRTVAFFPGSTIGNLEPPDARRFLASLGRIVGPGGAVIVGVDLPKDRATLEAAYDDASGVTAAFNRNVLARLVREHGASIDVDGWRHHAPWNEPERRVEMHLIADRAQTIRVGGHTFRFEAGASIVTEHCYKHGVDAFGSLARTAGLDVERVATDAHARFAVFVLAVRR